MRSGTDDRVNDHRFLSGIRETVDRSSVGMVLLGVAAGYSLVLLTTDTVSMPVVGSVPGVLAGGVGLAVSALAYRKIGCCGTCRSRTVGPGGCGCAAECENRRSDDR